MKFELRISVVGASLHLTPESEGERNILAAAVGGYRGSPDGESVVRSSADIAATWSSDRMPYKKIEELRITFGG